jgi:NO-binding membrane sensor protein with MHYT domain
MHFVAMLALSMPGMDVSYDVPLTALSLIVAILVTGIGLHAVSREKATPKILLFSGCFVGLGIVAMHYTGMAAMRMGAHVDYDPLWVAISVLIAVGAATVALWLAFQNTGRPKACRSRRDGARHIGNALFGDAGGDLHRAFGRRSRAWRREPRPDGTRGRGRGYDLPHPFPGSHRGDVRPALRAPR